MNVTYLGTGAAEGIPALFCECEFCRRARAGRETIRSRSQVVLDGELSIDFPPDAFYHNAVLGAELSKIRYLVVTHSHMDHFHAHDFVLRGYKYARELAPIEIFGNAETLSVFGECTGREMRKEVQAMIRLHELKAFEPVLSGGWRILPLKAAHSSEEPLVFALEKEGKRILHLTDSGVLPQEDFDYLERAGKPFDLITFDCTFLFDPVFGNARHMGVRENQSVFEKLCAAGLVHDKTIKVLTHFSHNSVPTADRLKKAEEEFGAIAAYDGMRLEL